MRYRFAAQPRRKFLRWFPEDCNERYFHFYSCFPSLLCTWVMFIAPGAWVGGLNDRAEPWNLTSCNEIYHYFLILQNNQFIGLVELPPEVETVFHSIICKMGNFPGPFCTLCLDKKCLLPLELIFITDLTTSAAAVTFCYFCNSNWMCDRIYSDVLSVHPTPDTILTSKMNIFTRISELYS